MLNFFSTKSELGIAGLWGKPCNRATRRGDDGGTATEMIPAGRHELTELEGAGMSEGIGKGAAGLRRTFLFRIISSIAEQKSLRRRDAA